MESHLPMRKCRQSDSAGRLTAVRERNTSESPPPRASLVALQIGVVVLVFLATEQILGGGLPLADPERALFMLCWVNNVLISLEVLLLRKSFGSVSAPIVMFAILLSLFTSGQLILYSFGVAPTGADVINRLSVTSVVAATQFYLLGFALFCLGCVASNEFKRTRDRLRSPSMSAGDWRSSLLKVGLVCVTIGIGPFLIGLVNNFNVVFTSGYSEYYSAGARLDSTVVALGYLLVTGLVFVAASASRPWFGYAVWSILLLGGLRLAAGDRGEGLIYLITGYLAYVHCSTKSRNGRLLLVGLLIFAFVVIPVIGGLRQTFGSSGVGVSATAGQMGPVVETLRTTGATLFPLVAVVQLVPGATSPLYGASYAAGAALLIPQQMRVGPLDDLTSNPISRSPANWLKDSLGMSYGPGFTPFAEAYLNFGTIGGYIVLCGFGVLFAMLLRLPHVSSPSFSIRIALVLATFALVGFSVRGSSNFLIPFLVRYVFLPGLAVHILTHTIRRRRESATVRS